MGGRAKAFDAWVQSHHGVGHLVASGIGIKATIDLSRLIQQGFEPSWIGPGAGGGETTGLRMERKAAEGINGGFTQDDRLAGEAGDWGEAQSERQSSPDPFATRGPSRATGVW